MNTITIKDIIQINLPRQKLFDLFFTLELRDVMKGYAFLPSVVGTREQSGKWNIPGSTRITVLSDGSTAFEEVTACEEPRLFSYRVSKFTNMFRYLVKEARGEWVFTEGDSTNTTSVKWTYSFYTKNFSAKVVLWPIFKVFWKGYMRRTLTIIKQLAEK